MKKDVEIWKDIVGYENLYQVSNWGRVKSLEKFDSLGRLWEEKILKPAKTKRGYFKVHLSKNGKRKTFQVHRLVAQAFIPNPNNLPIINHKDECPSNNFYDNLEWCNVKYNANWGTRNERISKTKTNGSLSKTVYQYSLNGELIKKYPSAHEVERQLGFSRANISTCCLGKSKTVYGYTWSYVPLDKQLCQEKIAVKHNTKNSKAVYQYSLKGEFIKEWPSVQEVERQTGFASSNICNCCNGKNKTCKGYKWSYKKIPQDL